MDKPHHHGLEIRLLHRLMANGSVTILLITKTIHHFMITLQTQLEAVDRIGDLLAN